jgi:hypothetical protein
MQRQQPLHESEEGCGIGAGSARPGSKIVQVVIAWSSLALFSMWIRITAPV